MKDVFLWSGMAKRLFQKKAFLQGAFPWKWQKLGQMIPIILTFQKKISLFRLWVFN